MILAPGGGAVAAVVDWELCTLGDPLADVGLLLVYWSEAGRRLHAAVRAGDDRPRVPVARRGRGRYAERSGRDLAEVDYFVALGYWKLAIILEGVYARYCGGQYGKADDDFKEFAADRRQLAEAAERLAAEDRVGPGALAARGLLRLLALLTLLGAALPLLLFLLLGRDGGRASSPSSASSSRPSCRSGRRRLPGARDGNGRSDCGIGTGSVTGTLDARVRDGHRSGRALDVVDRRLRNDLELVARAVLRLAMRSRSTVICAAGRRARSGSASPGC